LEESRNATIENEISVTVVFPDTSQPTNTNGGFRNQEEFRNYVLERFEDGKWDASIHSRPSAICEKDYAGQALAKAFPRIFPYGYSGLDGDPAVANIEEKKNWKKLIKNEPQYILQKYLTHRKASFHGALFNLIVSNILMKQRVFKSVCLISNCRNQDNMSFAERLGALTPIQLQRAIADVRQNSSNQFSTRTEAQFLQSISATCRDLPHTNEASLEARKIYFSFLRKFGLPAIFLTITPDDNRNYRIRVMSLDGEHHPLPDVNLQDIEPEKILFEFNARQKCRIENPGLCAEEYNRIMILVVKHLFQWDEPRQKSVGQGLFGELEAWCLATEEQGRKTLHGHFLLFIKGWKKIMKTVQSKTDSSVQRALTLFCSSISSARLFADFESPNGLLSNHDIFSHENCSPTRAKKRAKYCCEKVPDQILRDMRHKKKCHQHKGHVISCLKCLAKLNINMIVQSALQHHLGSDKFIFPDSNRFLEHYVYNSQFNANWYNDSSISTAQRYFANNALVNVHNVLHSNRCFKNGNECYANLPECPMEHNKLHFLDTSQEWFDYRGESEPRFLFRFYPQRNIEDSFVNIHSPALTKAFANNTNVLVAMNGPVVFYVTGYQAKSQQKEEQEAYSKVSAVLCKLINRQDEDNSSDATPYQQGF
jgi:hypothetical protein